MNKTMNDTERVQKREKIRLMKRAVAAALGFIPLITFFFPYVEFGIKYSVYSLSAFQLVTAKGLNLNGALVTLPLLAKISVVAGSVLSLLGAVLVLLKKSKPAGGAFALSALTPLLVLLTSSSVQTAVTSLNISQ